MKKKFTQSERALAAELGQAFTKLEKAIVKANDEIIEDLREIQSEYETFFVLDADRLTNAFFRFMQVYYKSVKIVQDTDGAAGN